VPDTWEKKAASSPVPEYARDELMGAAAQEEPESRKKHRDEMERSVLKSIHCDLRGERDGMNRARETQRKEYPQDEREKRLPESSDCDLRDRDGAADRMKQVRETRRLPQEDWDSKTPLLSEADVNGQHVNPGEARDTDRLHQEDTSSSSSSADTREETMEACSGKLI
jgi:hypothetical protein